MKQQAANQNTSASDTDRCNLTRGHIAALIAAPLCAMLVYYLLLATQGALIAAALVLSAKLAPILMGVAFQLGLEAGSLVVPVAIATSMAFMLPVATPPNALIHASGVVSQPDMMRAGLRLNLAAIVIITLLFHFGIAG